MYLTGGRSVFRSRAWAPCGQGFVSTSVTGGAGKSAQSMAGAGVCVRRKPQGSQMSSHRLAPWCCFNSTCCLEPPLSTILCFPGSLLCHRTFRGRKRDGRKGGSSRSWCSHCSARGKAHKAFLLHEDECFLITQNVLGAPWDIRSRPQRHFL